MKKCLVLGANGFIGKNLCCKLAQKYKVIAYDLKIGNEVKELKNVICREGNFLVETNFDDLIKNVDIIFHLISTTLPQQGTEHIVTEIENNLIPTIRLLESVRKSSRHPKLIFVSSGGTIYGNTEGKSAKVVDELKPLCSYGVQKQTIEAYIKFYGAYSNVDYTIARLSNPYGIGQDKTRMQGIVPIFINCILNNKPIVVYGNGTRDLIYLDDLTDAMILLAEYKGNQRIFNIGSGKGYTVKEVIKVIENISGKKFLDVVYEEKRDFDVEHVILDIEDSMKELVWEPKVSLEQGITLLLQLLREEENK